MANSTIEFPEAGAQVSEWRVTTGASVCDSMYKCREMAAIRYLLTRLWVDVGDLD